MLSLLPTENWEYKLGDIVHGLTTALGKNKPSEIIHIPGIGNCIPARSARAALYTAIKALDLPKGGRVGVPLYCCPVVFKAIEATGCTARFIDVEPTTYCMSADDLYRKRLEIDAVIPVHMFGNMCDMPSLQEAVQGIPIIEDCAQSIGSKLDGRMAGSFGTIAAFSFRSGKYLSVGEGGALFTNHTDIRNRLSEIINELPIPNRMEECSHAAKTYIRSKLRSKPLWGLAGHHIWSFYNRTVEYSAKSPLILSQIYKTDLSLTSNRLSLLYSAIEKQRANADYYFHTLRLDAVVQCSEKPGAYYNRYAYPLTFPSTKRRDLAAAYLFKQNIDTAKPYKDIATIASSFYGYKGDCPEAEQIAKRVLIIPCNYRLKKATVRRIAHCLNTGWRRIA